MTAIMRDESTGNLKDSLVQLRCHFTWKLQIQDTDMSDLQSRIFDQMDFLDIQCEVEMHNLLAYVKHLAGRHEEALKTLEEIEDLIQQEYANQSYVRSLITWGNYAWLHYHMGRQAEAQTYLDKVENTCKKLASPFRYKLECPEMDCKEGWALLKCGGNNYEHAKACFEKALEIAPENPEFNTGYAITMFRLDNIRRTGDICLQPLKQAIRLDPENVYLKVLLGLKLQHIGREAEGEKYIREALNSMSSHTYILRYAAIFYRRKGLLDKALQLLRTALRATPTSSILHHQIGLCYRSQIVQINIATKRQHRTQPRENVEKMARSAIYHLEYAIQVKPTFTLAYIHLAEMYVEAGNQKKAEDTYQKLLCINSHTEEELQKIYFSYGSFQEFYRKSEVNATIYYLKAIKIGKTSIFYDKSITSLEKLALRQLRKKPLDIESLSILGLSYKLQGKINEALQCYEQALRHAVDLEKSKGLGPKALTS